MPQSIQQSIWEINMRSILEQAVIHHLNGDADKAQELFHQFIVTRARQIHESMRNGEDPLAEGWDDQITSEETFSESELDELEALEDDNLEGDELGGDADLDSEFDGEEGEEVAADELGDELGLDSEEEIEDFGGEDDLGEPEGGIDEIEARVEDIEAELERLVAKFDEDNGEEDLDLGDEIEDDMATGEPEEEEAFPMESAEEGDEEDFEGLGESTASELEKVTPKIADATEVGAGGKISGNDKSGLPQKNSAARQGGSPVHLKSSQHKGFEREAAPAVATQKPRKNNVSSADAALSSVAAPSNKKEATEVGASGKKVATQTKSPVVPAKGVQK
jgi:hypothetical protein